jgi:hypothetical protein|tara:strand:- start:123 stop:665 length:543 start_codon:yes stop_codon:yes gene_type:complete
MFQPCLQRYLSYCKNKIQEKYKMKKISLITILLTLVCTPLQAKNNCSFIDIEPGTFTFTRETGKFLTTQAATLTVESLNRNNIKVALKDGKLYEKSGGSVALITVNYKNGGIPSKIESDNSGAVININPEEMALGNVNLSGITTSTFTIGGTATLNDLDVLKDIDNDLEVYIPHSVTCLQ